MMEKSNEEMDAPEYKKIMVAYTDEEIKQVLKKRKLYQKEAADFAIQEAIRRGIIYSEQDLFASEFKHEPERFSIFPTIENEKSRAKYQRSITRSLLVMGAIPMVWGGIKIYESQSIEGILIFIFGAIWCLTSFQLRRSVNIKLLYLMFFLLTLLTAYLVKIMISIHQPTTIDILVAFITVGFVAYAIGFLSKLKE